MHGDLPADRRERIGGKIQERSGVLTDDEREDLMDEHNVSTLDQEEV